MTRRTVGAKTVQSQFVIFHHEPPTQHRIARQFQRTNVQIENVLTTPTLKVLVVPLPRRLKPRFARRQNHALNLPAFLQQLDCAINGRQSNRRVLSLRPFVNFGDGQRPVRLGDDAQNGVALASLTLTQGGSSASFGHEKISLVRSDFTGSRSETPREKPHRQRIQRPREVKWRVIVLP